MSNNFFQNNRMKNEAKTNNNIFRTSSYNSTQKMITLDLMISHGCKFSDIFSNKKKEESIDKQLMNLSTNLDNLRLSQQSSNNNNVEKNNDSRRSGSKVFRITQGSVPIMNKSASFQRIKTSQSPQPTFLISRDVTGIMNKQVGKAKEFRREENSGGGNQIVLNDDEQRLMKYSKILNQFSLKTSEEKKVLEENKNQIEDLVLQIKEDQLKIARIEQSNIQIHAEMNAIQKNNQVVFETINSCEKEKDFTSNEVQFYEKFLNMLNLQYNQVMAEIHQQRMDIDYLKQLISNFHKESLHQKSQKKTYIQEIQLNSNQVIKQEIDIMNKHGRKENLRKTIIQLVSENQID